MRDFKKEIFLIYQELMHLKDMKEVFNFLIFPKDRINIVNSANNDSYYPTVLDKISFVYFTIVHNHYFSDGNKRTGTLFLITSLYKNFEFKPQFSDKYLDKFFEYLAISVANGTIQDWRIVKNKLVFLLKSFI